MTDHAPIELSTALADRYDVRRVLGRGGMATVYLADDRKHHREVALKVLLPALAAVLGVDRFLKEIEIVARLTHPHVLPLHDSGEAGGYLYYVMPYVEGGSLRDRLHRGGQLALDETLAIVRPVADALSYAHRMGILHRDIKPENILFSQGHPVVGDFGIARAVTTAGGGNLTRTGFPLGTPGYMSPEQAAGLTELDQKTDVYGLAVVIYEMLVGELPGRWPTEEAVRLGRLLDASPAARSALARAGSRVEAALVRALAVRHDQRTATPALLLEEMSGRAETRRKYSADEVQRIVHHAAELEATAPTQSGAMTLGGVEALAAEVGIAPDVVRHAASVVRWGSNPSMIAEPIRRNRWLNGPTRVAVERVVEGELPESEYTALVDEIRSQLKNGGQVSQLGRSFTWSPSRGQAGGRDLEVIVTVRGGSTRITILENLAGLAGSVMGGVGGGMGGGGMGPILGIGVGALGLDPLLLLGLIPAWLGGVYATARTIYRHQSDKRIRELENLADRLERATRELLAGRAG